MFNCILWLRQVSSSFNKFYDKVGKKHQESHLQTYL